MDAFNLLTGEEEYAARIASLPKTVLQYQFLAANNSKVIVQYKLYSYMLNRIDCIYSLYCFTKNVIDKMFFFSRTTVSRCRERRKILLYERSQRY